MTIFRLTRRQILGNRPDQVRDYTESYFATKALAEQRAKDILGAKTVCEDDWFCGIWTAPHLPKVEYIIDKVIVIEG